MTTTSQIQKKRPDVFVPDDVIQGMGDSLECLKLPEDMDARLKLQIPYVWYVVRMALRHPEQKGLVATNEEFEENVQLQGEGSFYDQLRDVARRKDWRSLLRNGTVYSFDLIAALRAYITPHVQMYSIAEHRRVLRHRRARPSLMP